MTSTKHIVALSGGKDSTALALALKKFEPRNYIYICNPTGDELPDMKQHWRQIERLIEAPIHQVTSGMTFTELIYKENMIPSFRARFCTRILKIEPTQEFIKQFDNAVLYVGLRADEESRKGVDYGVPCRYPLREWGWTVHDVWSFLDKNNITIPARTDCAMCFYQKIGEWWDLWHHYPAIFAHAEKIETDLGHTFRTPGKDSWPTALKDMRKVFETGRTPRNARSNLSLFGNNGKCRACSL